MVGLGIEYAEILLEALHHQQQLAAAVQHTRGAVVDDLARAADLIDQDKVLTLGESQSAHSLEAVRKQPLAVTAGIDRDDEFDIRIDVVSAAKVVSHDDHYLAAVDLDALEASFGLDDIAHFASCRNMLLADIARLSRLRDIGGGTDRSALGKIRDADYDGDAAALRGDSFDSLLAQRKKSSFA